MNIMGDITDLEKDTLETLITDTFAALASRMKSFEEGMMMIQTLEGEIANLRRIAESKKKRKGNYGQDSTLFKISYGEDGSKTFVPLKEPMDKMFLKQLCAYHEKMKRTIKTDDACF